MCSGSNHESFSGVPFHGNCVVPWIVSVFCQRWLVLRLIGQLDERPEVPLQKKAIHLLPPLWTYIDDVVHFLVIKEIEDFTQEFCYFRPYWINSREL